MRILCRLIALFSVLFASVPVAQAAAPSDATLDRFQRVARVHAIARRLLSANLGSCPRTNTDFGFTSMSLNSGLPAKGSTIIATNASETAAPSPLRIGDIIVSVNGVRWQSTPEGQRAFYTAMGAARGEDRLDLGILRDDVESVVRVAAGRICSGEPILTPAKRVDAWANGTNIILEGGTERLLTSDDELAWVIAHEVAHVFLGHSDPSQEAARKNPDTRSVMERDADILSVRLMLRAGFAPEAAALAQPKIANATRGPISRMLDIHGPYMKTAERTQFLVAQAAVARAEQH